MIVQPKEICVNFDEKNGVFVGGQKFDILRLEEHLISAARNNPANQSVIIRADKRCELDVVVQVINACKKAHVDHSLTTAAD